MLVANVVVLGDERERALALAVAVDLLVEGVHVVGISLVVLLKRTIVPAHALHALSRRFVHIASC